MKKIKPKVRRVALILITLEADEGDHKRKKPTLHCEQRLPSLDSPNTAVDWQGVILPTVGGKVSATENELMVLIDKLRAKFGTIMTATLMDTLQGGSGLENKILFKDEEITIYGLVVSNGLMDTIRPEKLKERLFDITVMKMSQLISVNSKWKHQPQNAHGKIPVFPKHRKAIVAAIKKFYL